MGDFLAARWSSLAMLSWQVDPALLLPLVPDGTELDAHDGTTYASLVGFRFTGTRVLGLPVPGHRDFDEVNLRFYLRRRQDGAWQRGVSFVRELVPRRAIAWLARLRYNEPYLAVPMSSQVGDSEVVYRWQAPQGGWNALRVHPTGDWLLPDAASRDGWIAEHYWGWTRQRDGGTVAYRVEHPPWRIRAASASATEGDLAATYGRVWAEALAGPPASAFLAEGSPITVGHPRRLPRG
ncbi:MAG: DUF2071 domain-containing protein [Planctomycetes bacterium]|nr:DUF2071 domain-containing protein [Planctomycetota bacterium]